MATSPDLNSKLTMQGGSTRTLDDWLTLSRLALVILPARSEGSDFVPIAARIARTLEGSNADAAICIPAEDRIAERILDLEAESVSVFLDPDGTMVASLGLTHLPAFVHLAQNGTIEAVAQGWDPAAWQAVANGIAKATKWTAAVVAGPRDPAPTQGWAI